MTKHYMSASGVKAHDSCPKQWWYRYESDIDPPEGDTRYLDLGSAVHDGLEDALQHDQQNDRNLSSYAPMRYQYYADRLGVDEHGDLYETGLECVKRAVEYVEDRDPDILDIEKEVEFDVDRPDLQETFRGAMDVATSDEIWDWKTGSIRDDTPRKEKIQGAVYMAAYRVTYGHPPEKVRFVYLKEEKVRSFDPSDEVWQEMLNAARRLAASKDSGNFEAQPGDKCYWCDYEQYCTEAGGVGTDFDWEGWMA